MFMEKGFRVLPASWKNVEASNALIRYGQEHQQRRPAGRAHLHDLVGRTDDLAKWQPLVAGMPLLQQPKP